MEGYRTATLDLKRRNRSSVPFADSEDDVGLCSSFYIGYLTLRSFLILLLLSNEDDEY